MPTIGPFHHLYWRTRANAPAPPGTPQHWMYPSWQSTVTAMAVVFWPPWSAVQPFWQRLLRAVRLVQRTWWFTDAQYDALHDGVTRVAAGHALVPDPVVQTVRIEVPVLPPRRRIPPSRTRAWWTWGQRVCRLDAEQRAVVERVCTALESAWWSAATQAVRGCATTPKFHQPEQWLAYSRAIKANAGQAQNVFRHIKVVQELQAAAGADGPLTNPQAHLLAELAYQGFAACGRADRMVH